MTPYAQRTMPGFVAYPWWRDAVMGHYLCLSRRTYARNPSVLRNAWLREIAAFTGGFPADI